MAQELFERVDRQVGNLLTDVINGRIGLPDLQRPFVWADAKVRDLFDSMMKGFPVGYVMLWASPNDYSNTKNIGIGEKQFKRPDDLVIDGQQRLTSLLAAITGTKVLDKNFEHRRIKISFEPLSKEFQVWTRAYDRSYQYIADIAEVFKAYDNMELSKFRRALIERMNEGRKRNEQPELTDEETDRIEDNINSLLSLRNYTIPTLRILSKADEEDVVAILLRLNLRRIQNCREEFMGQADIRIILEEDADRVGGIRLQLPGRHIRRVVHLLRHLPDPLSGLFADVSVSVQGLADRRGGNSAFLSYVLDCNHVIT